MPVVTERVTRRITFKRPWLYEKQRVAIFEPKDAFGGPARYSMIEASTKTGKTDGCSVWIVENAITGPPGVNHWWVAPIYPQAAIAFTRIKKNFKGMLLSSNASKLTLTMPNDSIIWFKGSENPDSLYGEDVYSAVVDEASRAKEEGFHAVRSTLTATKGPMRIIGNVKGRVGWFYKLARRAEAGEAGMAYYKIIAADAVAAGILSASEIADAKRILPEQVFKELYLAEPSDDGGNPFGLQYIKSCLAPLSTKKPISIGIDLAKSVDWTVITGLDEDGRTCLFRRFQKPWEDTIKEIHSIVGYIPTLIDSTGVGDPIVEMLQKKVGTNIEGYHFSQQSKQKLMENLAVDIQSRKVFYANDVVRLELEQFEYEYTKRGVRYSAPEGMHDDTVCSLALAALHRKHRTNLEVWAKLGRAP